MIKGSGDSFRFIIGSQYFLYFGIMGIFLPYFNLYCYHLDFTGFQIGLLSAIRTVTIVLFPLFWGALADRFQIRRPIYILCNFVSAGIWTCYFYTTDFWLMFVITMCYGIFYAPIISFLEAFTMDALGKEKKSYGKLRAWGSFSFIVIVVALGRIIDLFSIEIIIAVILAGSMLQAFISLKIPNVVISKKGSFTPDTKNLLKKRITVFLFCSFLMLLSHGTYYAFFSIHLDNLGYGKTFIGITWALASIAEILVMIQSNKIFKRFSLKNVLVFSFAIATLRWLILFFVKSPVLILLSQIFHAVTYGAFHIASILYIDLLIPDKAKTLGHAANNAVTYGLGMTVGFLFNGYFYNRLGVFNLFIISGLIALFGGLIFYFSNE